MAPPADIEPIVVEEAHPKAQVAVPQQKPAEAKPAEKAEANKGIALPFFGQKKETPEPKAAPEEKARFYEVQSGDTLGSIAIKFYDSSNPKMVDKIQRANKMSSPDSLQLGQKLVIPPANY